MNATETKQIKPKKGDVLVLVGDHAALESAFEALSPEGAP